ncbi:amidohydrolase/deacetylase family metallohydrolase [Candidatus Aerophobetes bacterium]|uniref:Amidohydrolase/deacetylase family metallohydrolase n=1 Tax=Aerophobetes bacterium TaxID=2030807 RepID=A0A497E375_UNCAE|nr:MAG: amidohydrolase/deacetylase family metallohydrolase [Candidatus Aerophobetes bacterium]
MKVDLLLKNGKVIDPAQKISQPLDVGIYQGKIKFLAKNPAEVEADLTEDVTGKLVVPGLIDLHTHVYWGGVPEAIKADPVSVKTGVSTFVDAGSAGAGNFLGFKEYVINRSKSRIFAFLNIYYPGLVNYTSYLPEFDRNPIQYACVTAAVDTGKKFEESIVGIKVMASSDYNYSGMVAVQVAIEAAKQLGKPVMAHFSVPPVTPRELLPVLRPGDILTHSFRGSPNSCLSEDGKVMPELYEAKKRGVIIDIGHGCESFSFEVARRMLEGGLFPDVISSDLHAKSINGPAYDLPTTMSKFLSLGMGLEEVIAATTWTPARVIGKEDELGHLKEGTMADIAVFELEEGEFEFFDGTTKFTGKKRLKHIMTIIQGEILRPLENISDN